MEHNPQGATAAGQSDHDPPRPPPPEFDVLQDDVFVAVRPLLLRLPWSVHLSLFVVLPFFLFLLSLLYFSRGLHFRNVLTRALIFFAGETPSRSLRGTSRDSLVTRSYKGSPYHETEIVSPWCLSASCPVSPLFQRLICSERLRPASLSSSSSTRAAAAVSSHLIRLVPRPQQERNKKAFTQSDPLCTTYYHTTHYYIL